MSYEGEHRWICNPCNRHYSLDDPTVYEGKGADIDPFVNFCPCCGQLLDIDDPSKEMWGLPQPTVPLNELSGGEK